MQQNRLLAKVFQYQICELPGGFPKNAAAPASREQPKVASMHFRRTSPTPSPAGAHRCVFSSHLDLNRARSLHGVAAQISLQTRRSFPSRIALSNTCGGLT